MTQLSIKQVNDLTSGTRLAAELSASSPDRRAFVVMGAYRGESIVAQRVSRTLNVDHSVDRYFLRVFEIDRNDMGRPDADDFEDELIYVEGVSSIQKLAELLQPYLADFRTLRPSWTFDYPL